MTEQELLKFRDLAEAGKVQFKERINDKYDIGCEMVAFSNSHGGQIIIGIDDKSGNINAMSFLELQETTNLLTNIASENVIPNVLIDVDNVPLADGAVVVATIPEGKNKPYHDNKGVIWVKNGADKRKVFDNSELAEMMSECGNFDPDEAAVPDATIGDLDADTIKLYLMSRFAPVFKGRDIDELNMKDYSLDAMAELVIKGTTIEKLLRNLRFIRPDGLLTVAAMLLFGKYTQRWLPVMTAKCISYVGNSVGGTMFRDKMHDMEIEGNILHQFRTIMNFFTRNLRKVQVERDFNSLGELEIPYECLSEYVVNALVHRSLNVKAPIRIFIFDDRVEIHSPGSLPNGLTISDIKNGTSMPRNMFLFTNANYLLPYTGAGSGVRRALEYDPDVVFSNSVADKEINHSINEFLITIPRTKHYGLLDSEQPFDQAAHEMAPAALKGEQAPGEVAHKKVLSALKGEQASGEVAHKKVSSVIKSEQASDEVAHKKVPSEIKSEQAPGEVAHKTDSSSPKSEQPRIRLSQKQKDIRNFCSVPRTAKEIMDRLGLTDYYNNRKRYIYGLVEAGVLERTIPDRPNDPNQKYRRKR